MHSRSQETASDTALAAQPGSPGKRQREGLASLAGPHCLSHARTISMIACRMAWRNGCPGGTQGVQRNATGGIALNPLRASHLLLLAVKVVAINLKGHQMTWHQLA